MKDHEEKEIVRIKDKKNSCGPLFSLVSLWQKKSKPTLHLMTELQWTVSTVVCGLVAVMRVALLQSFCFHLVELLVASRDGNDESSHHNQCSQPQHIDQRLL